MIWPSPLFSLGTLNHLKRESCGSHGHRLRVGTVYMLVSKSYEFSYYIVSVGFAYKSCR